MANKRCNDSECSCHGWTETPADRTPNEALRAAREKYDALVIANYESLRGNAGEASEDAAFADILAALPPAVQSEPVACSRAIGRKGRCPNLATVEQKQEFRAVRARAITVAWRPVCEAHRKEGRETRPLQIVAPPNDPVVWAILESGGYSGTTKPTESDARETCRTRNLVERDAPYTYRPLYAAPLPAPQPPSAEAVAWAVYFIRKGMDHEEMLLVYSLVRAEIEVRKELITRIVPLYAGMPRVESPTRTDVDCIGCGRPVGNSVFTYCDDCWDARRNGHLGER